MTLTRSNSSVRAPPDTLTTDVHVMQVLSVSYGLFAGLRGFLISLLNTQLMQNLR